MSTMLTGYPLGLSDAARRTSVESLNQLLADTISLRDMYEKHHRQVSGPTFYSLHLLFHKHAAEQTAFVNMIAERIHVLGGVALATAGDVAKAALVENPPCGREGVPVQVSRLLEAHEHVLIEARAFARQASQVGDDGTSNLLISSIIRGNEVQVWLVSAHLVDTPVVKRNAGGGEHE